MSTNDHGWGKPIGHVDGPTGTAVAFVAPIVDERKRCACPRDHCMREATQEDLLCDECRAVCR